MVIMDVLLINPPYLLSKDNVYSKTGAILPPLGLLYIAAYLRKKYSKINIQILDSPAYKLSLNGFRRRLKVFHPDIVGITVYTTTFSIVLKTAKVVKKAFPNCIIVVGGPHASILPEECLNSPHIDIAVVGEGEEVFAELSECINKKGDMDKVSNIVYKRNGKIVRTQANCKMINLGAIPMPARDLIDMRLYRPAHGTYRRLPATNMITSRGCPFRCSFCSRGIFGSHYRARFPHNIMEEIEILVKDYGIREVLFNDDVFTIDKRKTEVLCDLLAEKKLDFTWSCSTRVNLVDPPLLDKMRKGGCFAICYGIEAGDEDILKKIHKGFSLRDAGRAIQWTKEAGMETRASYILGFPGETKETIRRTIEVSLELDTDFVIYNLISPMPGTEMYEEVKKNRLFLYEGRELYDRVNGVTPLIKLSDMSPSELIQFYTSAYRRYYMRPGYVFKQLKQVRSLGDFKRYIRGFFSFLSWYREL